MASNTIQRHALLAMFIRMTGGAVIKAGNQDVAALLRNGRRMARQTRVLSRYILLRQVRMVIKLRGRHEVVRELHRQYGEAVVNITATIVFNFMARHTTTFLELLLGFRCRSLDRTLGRTKGTVGHWPRSVSLVRPSPTLTLFGYHRTTGVRVITNEVRLHDGNRLMRLAMWQLSPGGSRIESQLMTITAMFFHRHWFEMLECP